MALRLTDAARYCCFYMHAIVYKTPENSMDQEFRRFSSRPYFADWGAALRAFRGDCGLADVFAVFGRVQMNSSCTFGVKIAHDEETNGTPKEILQAVRTAAYLLDFRRPLRPQAPSGVES